MDESITVEQRVENLERLVSQLIGEGEMDKEPTPVKCREWHIELEGGLGMHRAFTHPQWHRETILTIEPLSYDVVKWELFGDKANEANSYWERKMAKLRELGMIKEGE